MNRTRSQILDVTAADLWVMDPATTYVDEIYSLKYSDVDRVRSISGVRWAVPFFKGQSRAIASDGKFRQILLMGLMTPPWPARRLWAKRAVALYKALGGVWPSSQAPRTP